MKATVIAHSNLALVKYWGKRDIMLNLPATGSISITLKELFTQTTVHFKRELNQDKLILNGQKAGKQEQIRVNRFLDLIRNRFGAAHFAEVNSNNNYY